MAELVDVVGVVLAALPVDPDDGTMVIGWSDERCEGQGTPQWGDPLIVAERVVEALYAAGLLEATKAVLSPIAEFGRRRAAELNARGADVCPVCLAPRDAGTCRWCPTPGAERLAEGDSSNASEDPSAGLFPKE